jgi:hypothetical protein
MSEVNGLLPKYPFSPSESVLDKAKASFRRLQNSPAAQTIVIADLKLRQALFAQTLSIAAQMNMLWATGRKDVPRFARIGVIIWTTSSKIELRSPPLRRS